MKSERIAAWAARKADQVARQVQTLPKATNGREARRKAEVASLLHARERRLRRMIPEPVWEGPF